MQQVLNRQGLCDLIHLPVSKSQCVNILNTLDFRECNDNCFELLPGASRLTVLDGGACRARNQAMQTNCANLAWRTTAAAVASVSPTAPAQGGSPRLQVRSLPGATLPDEQQHRPCKARNIQDSTPTARQPAHPPRSNISNMVHSAAALPPPLPFSALSVSASTFLVGESQMHGCRLRLESQRLSMTSDLLVWDPPHASLRRPTRVNQDTCGTLCVQKERRHQMQVASPRSYSPQQAGWLGEESSSSKIACQPREDIFRLLKPS